MPNWNNILTGLAAATAIGNKFRDPNKDQRNRLLQLLQSNPSLINQYKDTDNPDIASTLAGMKPRFGSSGGYDKLTSLINKTPDSPENIRNKELKKVLNYSGPNSSTPVDSKYSPVDDLTKGYDSDKAQSKDEYIRTGKISSPDDREAKRLNMENIRIDNKTAQANLSIAQQKAGAIKEEQDRIKSSRPIAVEAIGKLGKGANLYQSIVEGKVSPEDRRHMYNVPEIYKQIEDDKALYRDAQDEKKDASQRASSRSNAFVTDLMEKAMMAGKPLSVEQATAVASNPQLADKDPVIKAAIDNLKDYNKRKVLPASKALFIRAIAPITKSLQSNDPADQDVDAMNNASMEAWAGTGFQPLTFGLENVKKSRLGVDALAKDTKKIVITGGDPDLIKEWKGQFPLAAQQEEDNPIVSQAVTKFKTEQEFKADMDKGKVPPEAQTKLLESYRKKKGAKK